MDDLISRATVKRMLLNYTDGVDKTKTLSGMIELIVRDTPAVNAAPIKHGRWLTHEWVRGVAYCSECCYELKTNNTNFCPNCGAKMDGDNNG